MYMISKKYEKLLMNIFYIAIIFTSIYVLIKYVLPFLSPFIIGLFIAMINEPIIKLFENKLNLPRKLCSIIALILTLLVTGFIVVFSFLNIYHELVRLEDNISEYIIFIIDSSNNLVNNISAFFNNTLPESIYRAIILNLQSLSNNLETVVSFLLSGLISTISSIPKITVFLIVTLLSAYFISSDSRKIRAFIFLQFPKEFYRTLAVLKNDTFSALFGFLKTSLILSFFTFIEVSLGLFILKVDYAILIALLVALAESVPIFGTTIIMLPWIVLSLLTNKIQLAFGLAIIYIVGVIVRQILEPKILGKQIGLHPLATLFSLYIGLQIFGLLGMFIGPLSVIVLKSFQNSGLIQAWKEE